MLGDVTDFCRLILLRHPELDREHASLAVGSGPATLSRRGQARVVAWAGLLEPLAIERLFTPSQPQCRDAAQALAELKQSDVITEDRLRDQEMGRWQGRAWEEIMQGEPDRVADFFKDFGEVGAPEGESLGQAVERMLEWWTEVAPQGVGRTWGVVASGAMITGFTAAMLGLRLSRCVSLNLPHGGVGVLELFANGARIACWNPDALAASAE